MKCIVTQRVLGSRNTCLASGMTNNGNLIPPISPLLMTAGSSSVHVRGQEKLKATHFMKRLILIFYSTRRAFHSEHTSRMLHVHGRPCARVGLVISLGVGRTSREPAQHADLVARFANINLSAAAVAAAKRRATRTRARSCRTQQTSLEAQVRSSCCSGLDIYSENYSIRTECQ